MRGCPQRGKNDPRLHAGAEVSRKCAGTCKCAKQLAGRSALYDLDSVHDARHCCTACVAITCSDLAACACSCQVGLVKACFKGGASGPQRSSHCLHVPGRQLPRQTRHLQRLCSCLSKKGLSVQHVQAPPDSCTLVSLAYVSGRTIAHGVQALHSHSMHIVRAGAGPGPDSSKPRVDMC